jgi:hypothetical protein
MTCCTAMSDPAPPPTRLEKVVDVLAKLTGALWLVGFVLLLVNSTLLHKHDLYVTALVLIRAGFGVALIIVVSVLGTQAVRKARAKADN